MAILRCEDVVVVLPLDLRQCLHMQLMEAGGACLAALLGGDTTGKLVRLQD